jgi:hypothetical protein
MEVTRFGELRELSDFFGRAVTRKRARHLDLAYTNAMARIERERFVLLFKHHGAVANVVTHTKVRASFVAAETLFKQRNDMFGAIKHATWLRFEINRDAHTSGVLELRELARDPFKLRGR